jgi:hypothetical protein
MNAVDMQDHQLSSFPLMSRYAKGYKKIFFYLMDMGIFNSHALLKKLTRKNPVSISSEFSWLRT